MRPDMRPAQAVLLIYVPQGLLLEHLGGSLFKHIYPFQPCDPILDPDPSSLFAHHSIMGLAAHSFTASCRHFDHFQTVAYHL